MRKIINKENLDAIFGAVKSDIMFSVQNVEIREEIYNTFKKSFTRKSKELMDLYDFSDCLELVNDFVYLNNGFTSINYYVWSDIKRKIDKNGRLYGWEYLPFAVTFNINQGNETYHTIRYSISKDGFQELDGKYIVRQSRYIS